MHIKCPERSLRSFLVIITLFAILYIFGFMIQTIFSNLRFRNSIFERIDCGIYEGATNRATFRNKAFAAWSEFNIIGQWHQDMSETEESELEKIDARKTTSIINGTLSCFCESENEKHGFFQTTYGTYNFKAGPDQHLGEKKMVDLGA